MQYRAAHLAESWAADYGEDVRHFSDWLDSLAVGEGRWGLQAALSLPPKSLNHYPQLRDDLWWLAVACDPCRIEPHQSIDAMTPTAVLEGVLQPLVSYARDQANRTVRSRMPSIDPTWLSLTSSTIMRTAPWRLQRLLALPLVTEVEVRAHQERRELTSALPSTIDSICSRAGGRLSFLGAYPALARLVSSRMRMWSSFCSDLIERLWVDRWLLAAWLGVEQLRVTGVSPALGDEHGGGNAVIAIEAAGARFVYKPRGLALQASLVTFGRELERLTNGSGPVLRVPDTISREDYGWARWVERKPISSDAQATSYYFNLGSLQALAWMLNATDLHSENIIASGEWPWVVDTETFLTPTPTTQTWAARAYTESAAGSGILPFLVRAHDGTFVDDSAFGVETHPPEPPETAYFALFPPGAIHPVAAHDGFGPSASLPLAAEGYHLHRFRFHGAFVKGVRTGIECLAKHRRILTSAQSPLHRLRGLPCRVILRDTVDYGQLLVDTLHPDFMADMMLRQRHIDALRRSCTQRPELMPIAVHEVRSVLQGEVPLFASSTDSTSLALPDGSQLSGFFSEAGIDVAFRRLGEADSRSIRRILWTARTGVACHSLNIGGLTVRRRRPSRSLHRDRTPTFLADAALAIGQRLLGLAFDRSDLGWVDIHTDDGLRWSLDVGDRYIYYGRAGYILFFAQLAAATGSMRAAGARDLLVQSWLADSVHRHTSIGALDGAVGELYVAVRLAELVPTYRTELPIAGLVKAVSALVDDENQVADVVSGLAGTAVVVQMFRHQLCEYMHVDHLLERIGKRLLASAVEVGDGLAWPTLSGERLIGGGHGTAGVEYALRLIADAVPRLREAAICAARSAWRWQASNFDPAVGNWRDLRVDEGGRRAGLGGFSTSWCNGSAGIGLYRAASAKLRSTPSNERPFMVEDVERAVQVSIARGLGYGETLCHGDMSVAEFCLTAGRLLGREDMTERASVIAGGLADAVTTRSGRIDAGYPHIRDLPGFMSGAAGIGYSLLRMHDPDRVPSLFVIEY